MHRNPRRLVALIAALSMLVAGSSLASAHPSPAAALSAGTEVLPIFRGHVQPASHRPIRNNNLSSHGGPVQTSPKVYISWWGPEWSGSGFSTGGYTSAQAQTYNTGFFSNVGGSNWNNVVKQYCQNLPSGTQSCALVSGAVFIVNGTGQFGGAFNDTTSVPSSPTQTDIFNAAKRLMANFGYDPEATYMVYTPHGKSMNGFGTQWCAWHSSGSTTSGTLAYAYIPYMPDAGTSCGMNFVNANGYFDGFSIVAGHEYSEAETDPFPNSGWLDRNGAENADKCAWSASSTNISLGGHSYAVQPTWSNASGGCATSA